MVLDVVGGDAFTDSLRCLAEQGRILVVGFASGQGIPEVKVNRLLLGNTDVRGVGWGAYAMTRPGYMQKQWHRLAPMIESGVVKPPIGATYDLADFGRALSTWTSAAPSASRSCTCAADAGAAGVRVGRVTILDAAREGMNPDIRPQDDLFGHVNGRWLEETEIPSDKSSWGAFIALADAAEQQVRDIITELADRPADELDEDERKVGDLFASFMDTDTIEAKGLRPVQGLLDRAHRVTDLTELAAFLGIFERIGGPGLFGSYITPDRGDASRNIVYLAQGGLGLPDESYYRDDKFAEIREKYLAYLTTLLTLSEHDDPAAAAAAVLAYETRLAQGHWEAAETRDVQKTTNHKSLEELRELCPAFDWVTYVTGLGGTEETLRTSIVMQPDFFSHLSTVLEETPIETWRDILHVRIVRSSAPVPARRVRPGQLRLLRPHPQRHPGAARPLEARRRLRRGRHRRGRRQGLRRPPLPADVEADDGRAGRQPRHGLPPLDRDARLDGRGHQAEGVRQARPLLPQDRLPDGVPRLLRADHLAPTT